MLNVGRAIRWDSALGVGRHKVSDYVTLSAVRPVTRNSVSDIKGIGIDYDLGQHSCSCN